MIKFTDNGYQIHKPMVDEPLEDDPNENFRGRIPLVYTPETRDIYMGAPNWYHGNIYDAFPNIQRNYRIEGYLGHGGNWRQGLNWYSGPPHPEHLEVEKALAQAGYDTSGNSPVIPHWEDVDENDLWED